VNFRVQSTETRMNLTLNASSVWKRSFWALGLLLVSGAAMAQSAIVTNNTSYDMDVTIGGVDGSCDYCEAPVETVTAGTADEEFVLGSCDAVSGVEVTSTDCATPTVSLNACCGGTSPISNTFEMPTGAGCTGPFVTIEVIARCFGDGVYVIINEI